MKRLLFAWFGAGLLSTMGCSEAENPPTDASTDAPATDAPMTDAGNVDAADAAGNCGPVNLPALDVVDLAPGQSFTNPVYMLQAPGDSKTFYVLEQRGRIVLVQDGVKVAQPFLDIVTHTDDHTQTDHSERGLLGLAFHPDYATNGRFYVYYTPTFSQPQDRKLRVVELQRSQTNPPRAVVDSDPANWKTLLEIDDPQNNHNGGMMAFGADGRLYVAVGDGGGGCDDDTGHLAGGNGQNLDTLLGKLLRLDVDSTSGGFAASGNPFVGVSGRDEIWAYGLRNTWRFSFDRVTGDVYMGDVGQNRWEEINFQPASSNGGENYGWRQYEGNEPSREASCGNLPAPDITNHIPPIVVNEHDSLTDVTRDPCSITGGYVYRGSSIAALRGVYLYGDYCSNDIGALRYCQGAVMGHQRVADLQARGNGLVSFAEDHQGELYLIYKSSGTIEKIVAK